MIEDLAARVGDWDSRRTLDLELGALLRADPMAAEATMAESLAAHPGPVADACRRATAADVVVTGWEQVDADLTRIVRRGVTVTALGLDLSNYGDSDGPDWWDKDPLVEATVYDDSSFAFSTARREEMLEASTTYAAPWTGCMLAEDVHHLEVRGLRELNGLLLQEAGDATVTFLGWWWMHLRFQQAVARRVREQGLALAVPVVAGSHDAGPWFVDVHVAEKVSDHLETTERLLAERASAGQAAYDAHTEETATELRDLWNGCRGWGWSNRDKRRRFVDYADARVRLICSIVGVPPPRRSMAKMTDAELEQVIADYRTWRANR